MFIFHPEYSFKVKYAVVNSSVITLFYIILLLISIEIMASMSELSLVHTHLRLI